MKGEYKITVKNNVLHYQFVIRRNITIIKGDSATGKTSLVDMIREYYENGEQSGVSLQCEKNCMVLEGVQWKLILQNTHDSIVFIDEGNAFVMTDEFASVLQESDNYFVIVTRESLPNLPYSVTEIYGIKSSGKYGSFNQTYNEFFRIYGLTDYKKIEPEYVIIEDSNAGYEFFRNVLKDSTIKVVSSSGKSNVFKSLKEYRNYRCVVIADGAAFGPEMDRVMKRIDQSADKVIYLPESFEWLILKSGVLKSKQLNLMLGNPSEYIESSEYMSWERFFTAYLVRETQNTYLQYNKNKLNDAYLGNKVKMEILDEVPDVLGIK